MTKINQLFYFFILFNLKLWGAAAPITPAKRIKLESPEKKELLEALSEKISERNLENLILSYTQEPGLTLKSTLKGHTKTVNALVSVGNNRLASASDDWTIKIWDLDNNNLLYTLKEHNGPVYALANLSNNIIASGGQDTDLIFWNLDKLKFEKYDKALGDKILTLVPLKDNFLACGQDRDVRIWNLKRLYTHAFSTTGPSILRSVFVSKNIRQGPVQSIIATPNDKLILIKSYDKIIIYDLKEDKPEEIFFETKKGEYKMSGRAALLDGNKLAMVYNDASLIDIYDIDTLQKIDSIEIKEEQYKTYPPRGLIALNNNHLVLGRGAHLLLINLETKKVTQITQLQAPVMSLSLLSNGDIAAGLSNGDINIYSMQNLNLPDIVEKSKEPETDEEIEYVMKVVEV